MRASAWRVPEWAVQPSSKIILECKKEGSVIEIQRIDQQMCYRFGRNLRRGCDIRVSFALFFVA